MPSDTPDEETPDEEAKEAVRRNQVNYFGLDTVHRFVLPDGESYIEHKQLNEGERKKFQDGASRDVTFDKAGSAKMRMAPGAERHRLLEVAIVGWDLVGPTGPVPFDRRSLAAFLNDGSPEVIDLIEADIRKHNKWLLGDETAEDIRAQIELLEDRLAEVEADEEGKGTS